MSITYRIVKLCLIQGNRRTNVVRCVSSATSDKPSYFHKNGKEPLQQITVGELVDQAANSWPQRRAVVSMHENITLSFSELQQQANRLGASLLKLGLKPGDRIGVLGLNNVHWCVSMLAAAKAGLILVTINPAYRSKELNFCLNKVGAKALISDESFKTQRYYEILTEIEPNLVKLPSGSKIKSTALPSLEYVIFKTDKELGGAFRYSDVISLEPNDSQLHDIAKRIQPDDPVVIQYTSGTTGFPKAATLSHFSIVNNCYFIGKRCKFHQMHHTLCLQVPLFHIFGSVPGMIGTLEFGMTMVMPGPAFRADFTLAAMKKEKFTAIFGTPTMYTDLLEMINNYKNHPDYTQLKANMEDFKCIVTGGAVCVPNLCKSIAETFNCQTVQSGYGLTETSPILFTNTPEDTFEQRITTVGCVADHTEVKIVNNEGKMVPFGTPGELWSRGYANMLKYWNDEEKTNEAITSSRWFKTGDVVVLDSDGYGKIVGRIKDVVIRGGENIYPSEVENFLQAHPDIVEVYVYGVSDERMGEEVCASIILKPGSTITEDSIKEFCKGKIAHFKIPRYIRFVKGFPKTATGKIQKHVLREMLEKELGKSK